MRFAELESGNVAVWGYGREGRAVLKALRARFPAKPLTLYCNADEARVLRDAHDTSPSHRGHGGRAGDAAHLDIRIEPPDADALSSFDFVIKSPGISAYRPEILAAHERGTHFTSGTALWFGENASSTSGAARVVAVTGTKGKSTTTALVAHLARSLGIRTALAGNIGLPMLDLDGQHADLWVLELSSFQTGEAGAVELGVVVSLGEEHLDWHGTRERYVADKLKLVEASRTLLVDAQSPLLVERTAGHARRATFDRADGWHVADDAIHRGSEVIIALDALPLHGLHNARNACAALTAIELLGHDARAAAASLRTFRPLPHRLTALGRQGGVDWVDDSISTTPDAALAALESLRGRDVSIILGGFDRGLDWQAFARELAMCPPHAVVTQGIAGPRIAGVLRDAGIGCPVAELMDLAEAVAQARSLTPAGGVVLLSPGAPSFDQFEDYAARGRAFAQAAGFDGDAIGEIAGLGIA
jgi:UDP-N-acetylmuramoylalanine--D-glutamate ligase